MVQQNNNTLKGMEHSAMARSLNVPVSTKHCIEIAKAIRYRSTDYAKKYLGEVVALRRAVPFKTYKHNVGHKPGMASGRFPEKAARQFIKLVQSVEANAQFKGLNTTDLKIVKMTANLASIPSGGGRLRHKTKRTHLEIIVRERNPSAKKKEGKEKRERIEKVVEQVSEQVSREARVKVTEPSHHSTLKAEAKTEEKIHSKTAVKGAEVKAEISSEDLLKKAQARAAALNKAENDKKSVDHVSKLYDELTIKGTLRDGKTTAVKQ